MFGQVINGEGKIAAFGLIVRISESGKRAAHNFFLGMPIPPIPDIRLEVIYDVSGTYTASTASSLPL